MGELYEAEDLELHERVALKTILSHIANDERSIVTVQARGAPGETGDAPERLPHLRCLPPPIRCLASATAGPTRSCSSRWSCCTARPWPTSSTGMDGSPPRELLPVVRQMAAGLTAAHRVGVVHRDFKSQNVMLVKPTRGGGGACASSSRISVWRGGARHDESTSLSLAMSAENEIVGTPAYMAPEQVEGGPVTPATDVYALGVVLYEMVTGALPFVGETPIKTATKRLHEPPPSPRVRVPDVDPLWEATILRCLARRPEDRFASAGDVVSALEGASPSAGAAPAPTPTPFPSGQRDAHGPAFRRRSRASPTDRAGRWLRGVRVRRVPGTRLGGSGPRAADLPGTVRRGCGSVRRHGRAVHRQGAAGVLRVPGRVRGRRRPRRPVRPRDPGRHEAARESRRTAATR